MPRPRSKSGSADVVDRRSGSRIVVGVDGSEPSLAALQFAAEEATIRRASLLVVSVWRLENAWPESYVPFDDLVEASRRGADDAVARAREELEREWPETKRAARRCSSSAIADTEASAISCSDPSASMSYGTLVALSS